MKLNFLFIAALVGLPSLLHAASSAVPEQKASDIAANLAPRPPATERAKPLNEEAAERQRLANLGPVDLNMSNVPLTSVVRWLADQCGMYYVALPSSPEDADRLVTFSAYKNPWEVLQMLSESYNFGVSYTRGMWHFYTVNSGELVARVYDLKNDPLQTYDSDSNNGSQSSSNGTNDSNSNSSGQNNRNGSNSSNSSSFGNNSGGNSSSFGASSTRVKIKSDGRALEEAIQQYVDQATTSTGATFLETGSVGNFFPIPRPDLASAQSQNQAKESIAKSSKGKVKYLPDVNKIYVLATRQQHEWIEGFLEAADQPQQLISIETKFLETSRNSSTSFGLDWSGVTSGAVKLSGLNTNVNLANLQGTLMPASAILSSSDLSLGYSALANDSKATTVQYPRVVTINNRQVSMQSIVQRPVLQATTSTSGSGLAGSQTVQSIVQQNVGTTIDVLPKILSDNNVMLNIVISVSGVTGQVSIQGNSYPVVSQRLFNYQVIVKSGFTLAMGGLDETVDSTAISKVPGFGDVPFFGYLFSKREPTRDKRTLMMFITPVILKGYSGGLADKPQYTIPSQKQNRNQFRGTPAETIDDVRRALGSFGEEIAILTQLAAEGRATGQDIAKVDLLQNELDLMSLKLREEGPRARQSELGEMKTTITSYRRQLDRIRGDVKKSASFATHP